MSLTIGGVSVPASQCNETGRWHAGGDHQRMASGALGNSTRGTLRVFTVVTEFLQDEDYVALRAKLDLRTEQVITGELVDVSKAFVQFRGTNYRTEYDAGAEIVTRSARFELLESERRAA